MINERVEHFVNATPNDRTHSSSSKLRHGLCCVIKLDSMFAILLTLLLLCVPQFQARGVFEVRLKFDNKLHVDAEGLCCDGSRPSIPYSMLTSSSSSLTPSSSRSELLLPSDDLDGVHKSNKSFQFGCAAKCGTFFRICLKHYQRVVTHNDPCTFGEVETKPEQLDKIQIIPFNFTWPETFSLVIEAWYKLPYTEYGPAKRLIARYKSQHSSGVNPHWTKQTHRSHATKLDYEYRILCSGYSYGKGCSQTCTPKDDDFGHWECGENGPKCLAGWQGKFCDKAICAEGCKGSCVRPGECKCQYGYLGTLCDQCIRMPGCGHGTCNKPFECICEKGWGGPFCNIDLNYCTHHNPCRNGTCYNRGESYECVCHLGFMGKNCDIPVKDCTNNPCQNGAKCRNITSIESPRSGFITSLYSAKQTASYKCECPAGFSGKHCEKPFSVSCSASPCQNGGTCTDGPSGYMCICPFGYEGTDCEVKKTHCDQSPCQNDADCLSIGGKLFPSLLPQTLYKCMCRAGFTGDHCEININDCATNLCRNGGSCIDGVNTFQCICPVGYGGRFCDQVTLPFTLPLPPHIEGTSKLVRTEKSLMMDKQSSTEELSYSRLIMISVVSLIIPVVALLAAAIIFALKKRRWRTEERKRYENEEAIRQNEENTAKKCLQNGTYIVINNLDKQKSGTLGTLSKVTAEENQYESVNRVRLTVCLPPASDLQKSSSSTLVWTPANAVDNIKEDLKKVNNHNCDLNNGDHDYTTANNLTNLRTINMPNICNNPTIKEQLSRIH